MIHFRHKLSGNLGPVNFCRDSRNLKNFRKVGSANSFSNEFPNLNFVSLDNQLFVPVEGHFLQN